MSSFFYLLKQSPVLALLAMLWIFTVLLQSDSASLITQFGGFTLLGVVGAIFANATGAGGGVIFVPFFNYLGFAPENIVATSFAIQCCGMTAGALTWWRYKKTQVAHQKQWEPLSSGLLMCIPSSLVGIGLAQYGPSYVETLSTLKSGLPALHFGFGVFSVFLAVAIFASIAFLKRTTFSEGFTQADIIVLPLISFVGGFITAFLSVGVGELVAVYLIMRGFNVTMAIALAVILSAVSVWGAVVYHVTISEAIVWSIVLFAGAGAIVGGIVAKRVVLAFSVPTLKLFFGTWVLVLGLSGLPLF